MSKRIWRVEVSKGWRGMNYNRYEVEARTANAAIKKAEHLLDNDPDGKHGVWITSVACIAEVDA